MNISSTTNNAREYWGLWIGGGITFAIGLMHFFMPLYGYDPAIADSMSVNIRNHFYYLGTYAIGGFLLSLGFLSLYLAHKKYADIAFVFSIMSALFWMLRTILEIIYPTELSLFFLEKPVVVLLPMMLINVCCYLVFGAKLTIGWKTPPSG